MLMQMLFLISPSSLWAVIFEKTIAWINKINVWVSSPRGFCKCLEVMYLFPKWICGSSIPWIVYLFYTKRRGSQNEHLGSKQEFPPIKVCAKGQNSRVLLIPAYFYQGSSQGKESWMDVKYWTSIEFTTYFLGERSKRRICFIFGSVLFTYIIQL